MSHSLSDTCNNFLFDEPNFTQVPNSVFDYWMCTLDHCTTVVLLFLCRKTFGWRKKKDCLSIRKIEEGTKMSRNRVIKSLKILEDHGLIKKQMHKNSLGDQDPNTYELIIKERVVHDENYVVHDENHRGSAQEALGVVHGVHPQKKDIQNKNTTVCIVPEPPAVREIEISDHLGNKMRITRDSLFTAAVQESKDWTNPEIEEAWIIISKYKNPINDWLNFIDGTIKKLRIKKNNTQHKEKTCKKDSDNTKTSKTPFERRKDFYSVSDTSERPLAVLARQLGLK